MIRRKAVQKRWVLSRVVAPSAAGAKSRFVAVMAVARVGILTLGDR